MQLIRAIYKTPSGDRRSYHNHAIYNGKPLCGLRMRTFGDNSRPASFQFEVGDQPSCKACRFQMSKVGGSVA
jgi:hypothetical protein